MTAARVRVAAAAGVAEAEAARVPVKSLSSQVMKMTEFAPTPSTP